MTDWCVACNTYLSLLCEFKGDPSLPSKMSKHFEMVQSLYRSGQDWRLYDISYRMALANPDRCLEWGQIDLELMITSKMKQPSIQPFAISQLSTRYGVRTTPYSRQSRLPFHKYPPGYCHVFNKGANCSRKECPFSHTCFNCHYSHPFINCRKPIAKFFRPPTGKSNVNQRPPTSQSRPRNIIPGPAK